MRVMLWVSLVMFISWAIFWAVEGIVGMIFWLLLGLAALFFILHFVNRVFARD